MIDDWKTEIVIAVYVQNETMKLDTDQLWEYHLPEVAATEQELIAAERHLGFRLDAQYRRFLSYADGWRCFYQRVDLFGTRDLRGGLLMQEALLMLQHIDLVSLEKEKIRVSDLLPIAYSRTQSDLFLMLKPGTVAPGTVLWFAGYEIERYPDFDDFFLAMVDYNRLEYQDQQKAHGLI